VTLEEELSNALKEDYTKANLSVADRVMLDYVAQLSTDATKIGPDHIELLQHAGFDDRAILQINLLASWFNYINRVADGLGVGR
jgi:alkylhydroperoxidase family enzyme